MSYKLNLISPNTDKEQVCSQKLILSSSIQIQFSMFSLLFALKSFWLVLGFDSDIVMKVSFIFLLGLLDWWVCSICCFIRLCLHLVQVCCMIILGSILLLLHILIFFSLIQPSSITTHCRNISCSRLYLRRSHGFQITTIKLNL